MKTNSLSYNKYFFHPRNIRNELTIPLKKEILAYVIINPIIFGIAILNDIFYWHIHILLFIVIPLSFFYLFRLNKFKKNTLKPEALKNLSLLLAESNSGKIDNKYDKIIALSKMFESEKFSDMQYLFLIYNIGEMIRSCLLNLENKTKIKKSIGRDYKKELSQIEKIMDILNKTYIELSEFAIGNRSKEESKRELKNILKKLDKYKTNEKC